MIRIKSIKRKNPTDHKLLKNIRIEKTIDSRWNVIDYKVFLNQNQIAWMQFDPVDNTVFDSEVSSEFRRKGIATYVYDFIEKDLGIKVKPNKTQLDDGVAFWKNRLKTRTNPTDKIFLSKIKIEKVKTGYYIRYKALLNKGVIATADFFPIDNSVSSVYVDSPYRRKGLASFIYNTIEKDQKVSLIPSQDLLDGRRFWENRLKGKPEKLGLLYR